jgi:hypothetical protein
VGRPWKCSLFPSKSFVVLHRKASRLAACCSATLPEFLRLVQIPPSAWKSPSASILVRLVAAERWWIFKPVLRGLLRQA